MAKLKVKTSGKSQKQYIFLRKLTALVSIVLLFAVTFAGFKSGASTIAIMLRAVIVIYAAAAISRIVLKILKGYEEMHGGNQA